MEFFSLIQQNGLEQLVYCHDEAVGLRAIIAIHNTLLGPALAPVRMLSYEDETAAVTDAVNVARCMSYRTAIADCDLGGGSAVLWASPDTIKSEAYFRAFGRFIERFGGRLYVLMGEGTDESNIHDVKRESDKVLALPIEHGGMANAVELAADGVLQGLEATARELTGKRSLGGLSCLVQGLQRVGRAVVERLVAAGATLVVTDTDYDRIKWIQDRFPAVTMVRPDEALDVRCDIIVPCSARSVIHTDQIGRLKCRAIAGATNFFDCDLEAAEAVHEAGVLYVPHFLVDAGEAMLADYERKQVGTARLNEAIKGIYRRTRNVLEEAAERKISPVRTALERAQQRLTSIAGIGQRNAW